MSGIKSIRPVVKLSNEAKSAIKRKGPTDNKILGLLNYSEDAVMRLAQPSIIRWLAYNALVNLGYKFEE